MLKAEVVSMTKNPYAIHFKNHSAIFGFTTGASSGQGAASIRGQRADHVYMDEVDYMSDADFDSVTAIAAERSDIGITMSSTPTGRRSQFYKACTDKAMGLTKIWAFMYNIIIIKNGVDNDDKYYKRRFRKEIAIWAFC